jgi:hypothetical protein
LANLCAVGRSHFHIDATLNTRDNKIAVELCITDKNKAKAFYRLLESNKDAIENEVGTSLECKKILAKLSQKSLFLKMMLI